MPYKKREDKLKHSKQYYINNKHRFRKNENLLRKKRRKEVIEMYGGICTCCGESNYQLLTIDHVFNDGKKHREETGTVGGLRFYYILLKSPRSERFQVLCFNCNWGKTRYGICPHKNKKEVVP